MVIGRADRVTGSDLPDRASALSAPNGASRERCAVSFIDSPTRSFTIQRSVLHIGEFVKLLRQTDTCSMLVRQQPAVAPVPLAASDQHRVGVRFEFDVITASVIGNVQLADRAGPILGSTSACCSA